MKSKILTIAFAALLIASCGTIQNTSSQTKGTAIGAAGGAILGAIIGNNVGDGNNQTVGVISGAVIGGVAGNLIGRKMDKQAEEMRANLPGANVERVGEGIVVTFDEGSGVKFATGQFTLNESSKMTLNKLTDIMLQYPGEEIIVAGHTDSQGDEASNLELSRKRASSVRDYLIARNIASSRIAMTYSGESQPKATNDTAAGRAQNRRVEIGIVASEEMRKQAEMEANKK